MKMARIPSISGLLDASFPPTRESRFGLRPISLDTRFRGYDGTPVVATLPLHVFSKEVTKDTKVSENYFSELLALRVLRGEIDFFIERDYLRTPVRKICASFANCELLQRKVHKNDSTLSLVIFVVNYVKTKDCIYHGIQFTGVARQS